MSSFISILRHLRAKRTSNSETSKNMHFSGKASKKYLVNGTLSEPFLICLSNFLKKEAISGKRQSSFELHDSVSFNVFKLLSVSLTILTIYFLRSLRKYLKDYLATLCLVFTEAHWKFFEKIIWCIYFWGTHWRTEKNNSRRTRRNRKNAAKKW